MNPNEFFVACEKAFAQLPGQYGFSMVKQKSGPFKWEWTLKNLTTGIKVVYEVRELYARVLICRLVVGKVECMRGEIRPGTTISCFDLKDLLALRKEDSDRHLYGVANVASYNLSVILEQYVQDLQNYGTDILQGDFEIFCSLEAMVKKRARDAAYRKWGEKAKEFGW